NPQGCNRFRPNWDSPVDLSFGPRVVEPSAVEIHVRQVEARTVRVAESTIDPQENHGLELRAGGIDHSPDVLGTEHLGAACSLAFVPLFAFVLLARGFELGPELYRLVDQIGIEGVLEHAPHNGDF